MKRNRTSWQWIGIVLVGLALVGMGAPGCVGHIGEDTGTDNAYLIDLEPSGEVAASVWQEAPEGCHGRLDMVETWTVAWAEGEPSLGVVVDEDGTAICVDTWDSIADALSHAMGDPSPDPMLPPVSER